jgi:hypothetical protein
MLLFDSVALWLLGDTMTEPARDMDLVVGGILSRDSLLSWETGADIKIVLEPGRT